jgi:hypothetical protein
MNNQHLQQLRALPIEEVAARLGLDVRAHKALCPFHADHHPSLSFNVRRNSYRCFVCDAHGGTIDLVMHLLHKTFPEACSWLSNGTTVPGGFPAARVSSSPPNVGGVPQRGKGVCDTKSFDPSRYARFFARPYLSPAAKAFLFDQRHLDPRVIRWCRLTSWRDRQGVNWLQIPYYSQDGHLIGIQNRNLNYQRPDAEGPLSTFRFPLSTSTAPRFKFPKGSHCSIYNLPVLNKLKPGEPLYIAEGASDCWALLSAGHKAIAIPSATLLTHKDKDQLLSINYNLLTPFHMYPDRDAPGERLFLQLKDLLPNLQHHHLPPSCKDFSDYYLQTLPTVPAGFPDEKTNPTVPAGFPGGKSNPLNPLNPITP